MKIHQKKIIFTLLLIAIALGFQSIPQGGRVITVKDELNTNNEALSLISLESRAAVFPSSDGSEGGIKIGPESSYENQPSAIIGGAFISPLGSFDPPFKRKGEVLPPDVTATIAFIGDVETGIAYLEKGANRHWPIASITKLMTAVVASRVFASSTNLTVTPDDLLKDQDASSAYLKVGEIYHASDLIEMMLIASDNVAAEVLARSYGREKFLSKMNEQAQLWGMSKTYYYDPSGLSPVNQSSADDLQRLAFHLVNEEKAILAISRKPGVRVTEITSEKEHRVLPINIFAGRSDFVGGKTGFTDEAGGNLLSIFSVKGRPILILVFNSTARFDDTSRLLQWFKEHYE